jgi:heptosyltransferase I
MARNPSTAAKKILVVRVGRAGDLIMVTPAVNALLAAFPEVEFHLLTTSDGRRIMAGYDERITTVHLYTRKFPYTLVQKHQLVKQLRSESYSHIYIFETKPRYRNWLRGLAPEIHALPETSLVVHFSDRCLDLVSGRLVSSQRGWATLPVTEDGRRKARDLLTASGVDPDARLVGLHPTFSGDGNSLFRDSRGELHRKWPEDSFAALAKLLVERSRTQGLNLVVLIDALPEEREFGESIVARSEGAITLLSAPPDFQRYKGLLSLLDVMVTPNTGPMHIAAALGTPLVALFSGWDPLDCGPFMDPDSYHVLRAEDTACPEEGLSAIEPFKAADAVWDLLKRNE